ncbi:MAG: phytanoyl-CoA dioxygenase family protein [Acidobacteriia bacterium]|nr:phytanoyl-CoA dioxygenase family protein [Terriglobia bacterium]
MPLSTIYREQGYVLLEQALPAELIEEHVFRLDEVYRQHGIESYTALIDRRSDKTRFQALLRAVQELHNDEPGLQLTMHPGLREPIAEVLQGDPIRVSALSQLWGSEATPHADTSIVWRGPWQTACRAWCALEDIHPEAGPLFLYPKTHLTTGDTYRDEVLSADPKFIDVLGELGQGQLRGDEFHLRAKPLFEAARDLIAARVADLQRVSFPIRRGDVVVFSFQTIHGGEPIIDKSRRRRAMIMDWHLGSTEDFLMNAYWGETYDHRCEENRLEKDPVQVTTLGSYATPDLSVGDELYLRPVKRCESVGLATPRAGYERGAPSYPRIRL